MFERFTMYIYFVRARAVGGCGGRPELDYHQDIFVRGRPLTLMFTVGRCMSNR